LKGMLISLDLVSLEDTSLLLGYSTVIIGKQIPNFREICWLHLHQSPRISMCTLPGLPYGWSQQALQNVLIYQST
jgi:hypothetical protein